MKVVSVNVGLPQEVEWQGKIVRTSIFKTRVSGSVRVARLNLDGDKQSDLTVHGGVDKAVYAYPAEHYPFWKHEFPELDLQWGALGENLTIEGLTEDSTNIGDRLAIGSAEFVVTQPRMPCYKLGIRFQDPGVIKKLLQSRKSGFYLAVLKEGAITAGDPIRLIDRDEHNVSVTDIVNLYTGTATERQLVDRALELPALPVSWRDHLRKQIALVAGGDQPGPA